MRGREGWGKWRWWMRGKQLGGFLLRDEVWRESTSYERESTGEAGEARDYEG